ncbi:hypothetical protein C7974DRAFT_375867 [Boeremia exigua]|uniref:uncharacterized protein n=1 Tax=Boeremia exigua TaxID=749465 RepID=UPI001E8EC10E|nr:uncharacterized protein C7974DRAFT_375867 [Boeremia exigua]KAH6628971.1 hypothetical protein C7974DRAFT_375867 [Boeremia exigua]
MTDHRHTPPKASGNPRVLTQYAANDNLLESAGTDCCSVRLKQDARLEALSGQIGRRMIPPGLLRGMMISGRAPVRSRLYMGIIVVAGGSGPVGQTIVDGLLAHTQHKIFVFSRTVITNNSASKASISYLEADYDDVRATSDTLEASGVDTVICAIGVATPATNQAQLNLIKAAALSQSTRRFVISSFDMLQLQE